MLLEFKLRNVFMLIQVLFKGEKTDSGRHEPNISVSNIINIVMEECFSRLE